jgi:hypothetical protein
MQTPGAKTPISKCLDLAAYTARMLGKFPANGHLASLIPKLTTAAKTLDDAQSAYAAAVKAILPTRVDVKYENFASDRRIRLTQQKAEMADGVKGGPIATQAFPEGSAPIIRLLGSSQVNAMVDLEGRLSALLPLWAEASAESAAIAQCRSAYAKAIDGRESAGQKAANLRAVRDVAKQSFLNTYDTVTKLVAAEFPRDTVMQDLFFDDVREGSAEQQADDSGSEPGGEGQKPAAP